MPVRGGNLGAGLARLAGADARWPDCCFLLLSWTGFQEFQALDPDLLGLARARPQPQTGSSRQKRRRRNPFGGPKTTPDCLRASPGFTRPAVWLRTLTTRGTQERWAT